MKKNIATEIEELVLPITDANNLELVDVEYVKEGGEFFLRIYIDKDGGVSLNECELVTRALNPILDEKDPIKDNYYLEVSSPGLDRPLKKEKDFVKYQGRDVEIKLYKPINGSKMHEGGASFTGTSSRRTLWSWRAVSSRSRISESRKFRMRKRSQWSIMPSVRSTISVRNRPKAKKSTREAISTPSASCSMKW